jgi:hypothetical protein
MVQKAQLDERTQNRRTALALATIALLFFVGVILRHWLRFA